MTTSQISEVIQHLRRARLLQDAGQLTDGQLLESFLSRQDAAALEALVRRHAPMVWGVCRRVLGNHHDAEDAFQATFFVLIRKAASIRSRAKVGNWLYGVAHQTALKARAMRAKRRLRERPVTQMPEPAVTDQDLWNDLQPLLDQEVSRLPEKYRTVIVLCDLEGRTVIEAARQLGCPAGTVASRLARARTMLAKRLAAKGVVLSGGALAALLSEEAVSASVPPAVLSATIQAVTLVATGQAAAGLCSTKVAALSEGVVKAMLLTKLKTLTAVLLVVTAIASSGGLLVQPTSGEEVKAEKEPAAKRQEDREPAATGAAPHQVASFEDFTGRIVDREVDQFPVTEPPRKAIMFRFDIDERSYLRYQRLLAAKKIKGSGDPLAVRLADEANFDRVGVLVGFENKFNPATGSIGVLGVLSNTDGLLRPGMSVRVRMSFGPPPKASGPVSRDVRNPLQGAWIFVSFAVDGEKVPVEPDFMAMTFEGDRFAINYKLKENYNSSVAISSLDTLGWGKPKNAWDYKSGVVYTSTSDAGQRPGHLDFAFTDTGRIKKLLYEIDGDTLRTAQTQNDVTRRPKSFTDRGVGVITWKRANPPKTATPEAASIQGTWHLSALESDGEQAAVFARQSLVISAEKIVIEDALNPKQEYRYVLQPDAKPKGQPAPLARPDHYLLEPYPEPKKGIDLIPTFGVKEGKVIKGIYRLEGDRLYLCLNYAEDGERPAKFATEAGTKVVLKLYERDKKDPQPPEQNGTKDRTSIDQKLKKANQAIVEVMHAVNKKTSAAAAAFEYPGTKRLEQRHGNAGVAYAGSICQSLCTTTDDLSKVAEWYDKKLAGLIAGQPVGVTGEGDRTRRAINQDGERPDLDGIAKRPMSTRTYLVRTKSHTLSVVISPKTSEDSWFRRASEALAATAYPLRSAL